METKIYFPFLRAVIESFLLSNSQNKRPIGLSKSLESLKNYVSLFNQKSVGCSCGLHVRLTVFLSVFVFFALAF